MIHLYEPDIDKKDIAEVLKVLQDNQLSGNTQPVKNFENKLKDFLSVEYTLACSNGTTSLHLALISAGVSKGDEVIIPTLTYIASANTVSYIGANPILVDVNKDDWQMDIEALKKKITKKTKAIMPVHLYGGIPNIENIGEIAKTNNIKIVHDAAESLGAKYKNIYSGKFDDVSSFSFFPNKIITTGEGGLIATNNHEIYEKALSLRSQGLKSNEEYVHDVIGYNYRMSALNAALGLNQITKIDKYIKRKKQIYEFYVNELKDTGINFQNFGLEQNSSYWLTVALLNSEYEPSDLKKFLQNKGVETRRVFMPIHMQEAYEHHYKGESYPIAESIYNKGLCLPSYPTLDEDKLKYIVRSIKEFLISK